MKFEQYGERLDDPKILFEAVAEQLADDGGFLINPLIESDDHYEFELTEMHSDEQLYRIARQETEEFTKSLVRRLSAVYPHFEWGTAIQTAGDISEPTGSVYVDYRLLRGEE